MRKEKSDLLSVLGHLGKRVCLGSMLQWCFGKCIGLDVKRAAH